LKGNAPIVFTLLAMILLSAPVIGSPSESEGIEENNPGEKDHVSFNLIFDPSNLQDETVQGYSIITAKGFSLPFQYGEAALPFTTYRIIIHPLGGNPAVNINHISKIPFKPDSPVAAITHFEHRDSFESNDLFGSSYLPDNHIEIIGEGWIRGSKIIDIRFNPIAVDENGDLLTATHIEGEISFEIHGDSRVDLVEPFGRSTSVFRSSLCRDVLNPDDVGRFPARSMGILSSQLENDDVQYIVVTDTEKVGNAFDELIQWKIRKGVPSRIVEMDFIKSSYNGTDNAEKLRNFLKDAVDVWDTEMVLLGGDTSVVPYRGAYVKAYSGSSGWVTKTSVASDLYFSDLDGSWNSDGDGYWGEVEDTIDMKPDLYVGRAPVQTPDEAGTFVLKTLTYEKNPPSGYLNNTTLAGEYLDPYTNSSKGMDLIKNNILPSHSVPTSLYDSDYRKFGNLNRANFMDQVDLGSSMILHAGHCNWNTMSVGTASGGSMYNSHVPDYKGGMKIGVLNTVGCIANRFDKNDAIVELHVMEADGGTVAGIGNSHYGWYSYSSPGYGPSERVQYKMIEDLMVNGHTGMGEHFSEGKEHFTSSSGGYGSMRWVEMVLNLIGDPEMDVRTRDPLKLNVSLPETIGLDYDGLPVSVRSWNGTPLKDALVCLEKSDYYSYGRTDENGLISFDYNSSLLDNLNVTVTAFDHLPATFNISVDIIAPRIVINSGYRATTGDPLNINCSVFDEAGIESVFIETEGNSSYNLSLIDGYWKTDLSIPEDSLRSIPFRIVARDRSGNLNSTLWMEIFVEDDDDPVLNRDLSGKTGTTGDTFAFKINITDNIDISDVHVEFKKPDGMNIQRELDLDGEYWSYSMVLDDDEIGTVEYRFRITDTSNNTLETELEEFTILDDEAPELEDTSDTRCNTSATFTISARVDDNIGVSRVMAEWWVEGWNIHRNETMISSDDGIWEIVIPSPSDELDERNYIIHAVDGSGNWNSTSGNSVIIIDGQAPELVEDRTPESASTGEMIAFSVKISDNIEVRNASVLIGSDPAGKWMDLVFSENTWHILYTIPPDSTEDIVYNIGSSDIHGNNIVFQSRIIEIIDTIIPEISNISIPSSAEAGSKINLTIEAVDNIGITNTSATWWFGGEKAFTSSMKREGNVFSVSVDIPITSFGTLYLTFEVRDLSGNVLVSERYGILIIEFVEPEPQEIEPRIPKEGEDLDFDGIDDLWEFQYDLDLEANDSAEDPDEDGYSNLREFLEGTSPRDPSSHPVEDNEGEDSLFYIVVAALGILALLIMVLVSVLVIKGRSEKSPSSPPVAEPLVDRRSK
jgi:hypothetical protein